LALNLAVPRKWITGARRVTMTNDTKNIIDQMPKPLPKEKYNDQPNITNTHGAYLRENNDILALTNSSEYN
jgi:hypothetical protein